MKMQNIMKHVCIIIRFNILGLQPCDKVASLDHNTIDDNENRERNGFVFCHLRLAACDVTCKLAMGLFGNLDSTHYLNLFANLTVSPLTPEKKNIK